LCVNERCSEGGSKSQIKSVRVGEVGIAGCEKQSNSLKPI
jgi:hypothetical protein